MNRSLVPAVTLVLTAALAGCSGPGASSGATESVVAPSLDARTTAASASDAPATAQGAPRGSASPETTSATHTVTQTVAAPAGTSEAASAGTTVAAPSSPSTPVRQGPRTTVTTENAEFWSPSGTVHCGLSGDFAACEVSKQRFDPPAKPATCEWEYSGDTIEMMGDQAAEFRCASDEVLASSHGHGWWTAADGHPQGMPDQRALGYGHTLKTEALTCSVDRATGVTCKRLDGSHGFTLSRDAYRTW